MRSRMLVVASLLLIGAGACSSGDDEPPARFGGAGPTRLPPDTSASSSSSSSGSSGSKPRSDGGGSSGAAGCGAAQTFALGPTFGTLNDDGGAAVISAGGTEMNVDATTSVDFARVIDVTDAACPLELGLDTKMFSTTSGMPTDLVWIEYTAGTETGTLVLHGWSPSFADQDDTFELVLTRCPGGTCGAATYSADLPVDEAAVLLRVPLSGGGSPSLKIAGVEHVEPSMMLPDPPITRLTVHVGHRSNDTVEGTITYESVTLAAN